MILVDTSVWIDTLGKRPRWRISAEELISVASCPPIIQEVLQGVKHDSIYETLRESMMSLTRVGDPVLSEDYLHAADLFRFGRKKGYTLRSSIDCLIAAIAIREHIPVYHFDRDFDAIANFSRLIAKCPQS